MMRKILHVLIYYLIKNNGLVNVEGSFLGHIEQFQAVVAKVGSIIRRRVVVAADKRVALMNEILNSIRLIKMYAWEEPFIEKIRGLRSVEIR